ncbi:MAG: trigger factor [Candidatus Omnitrophica bacterium]|nr:trigger factor [Candidatus Omnitrophota bacterium]
MKSNLKKIKDCRHAVAVEVEAGEVDQCFDEVYVRISKHAKLPGFRPGKVPRPMVESTFADTAAEEVLKALIGRTLNEAFVRHEVQPVGHPGIRDVVLERGKKMKYVAEFDVKPDFKLRRVQNLKLKKPIQRITDADVDRAVDSFRQARGVTKPLEAPRPAVANDILRCDLEVLKDGKVVQPRREAHLELSDKQLGEKACKELIGIECGQEREITIEGGATCRIHLHEIKIRELPPVDDEFAKAMGATDVADLRQRIQKDMTQYSEHQATETLKNRLYEALLKENAGAVPASMVEAQKKGIIEELNKSRAGRGQAPNAEAAQKELETRAAESAERQVRLYFILEKVAEEQAIQVSDEDLARRIAEISQATGRSVEDLTRESAEDIRAQLRHDRVTEFLIKSAQVEEIEEKTGAGA